MDLIDIINKYHSGLLSRLSGKREMITLSEEELVEINTELVTAYGGDQGFTDSSILQGIMEMAGIMATMTHDIYAVASSYIWYITKNKPFLSRNKMTAAIAAIQVLNLNGEEWKGNQAALEFLVRIVEDADHIDRESVALTFRLISGWPINPFLGDAARGSTI